MGELSGVKSSNLDFINKNLTVDFDGDKNALFTQIENVVHKLEPDVSVKELGDCAEKTLYLKLEDLDCPNCGEKIANRVGELAGVISSNVDFISKKLTVKTDGSNPDLRIHFRSASFFVHNSKNVPSLNRIACSPGLWTATSASSTIIRAIG